MATEDSGRSWTRVVADCGPRKCDPALFSTADGGRTWIRYDLGAMKPRAVGFADAAHGWLTAEDDGLYVTEDGGRTWTQVR